MAATFSPILDADGSGSGVHIHFSLRDQRGTSVLYDPARPGRLSSLGAKFCAGILTHARALSAWTAPSPVSFIRLAPHRWSSGGIFLAERNREALLRICPTTSIGGWSLTPVQCRVQSRGRHGQPLDGSGLLVKAVCREFLVTIRSPRCGGRRHLCLKQPSCHPATIPRGRANGARGR
jgi:hypothetical protein